MALRGLCPGESTEQIIRQVEKMSRNMERSSRDNFRSYKVISLLVLIKEACTSHWKLLQIITIRP